MPGIDEFGLIDCQVSCDSNRLGLRVVYMINAVELISNKVGAKRLVIQLLATRFLPNMTVNEGPELVYMSNIGLYACPSLIWRSAI